MALPYIILLRRGLKANLPASAPDGEAFLTTDTHELFVGTGTGMQPIASETGNATAINGIAVLDQVPDEGQILIFDGATGKYVPGDPIVSGPDAPGVPPTRPPVQVGIFDGTNVQRLKGNTDGTAIVSVGNFPTTQPVSATALPLPAGAATDSTLGAVGMVVSALTKPTDTQLVSAAALPLPAGAATATNQATGNSSVASIDSKTPALAGGKVPVDGSGVTQPVSAASLPLPAGAATSANQAALVSGRVPVDPSGVTSPISAAALPLPSGAATATNQATGNSSVASIDSKTPALAGGKVPVDGSGVTQPVSAASLPLPAGAATSANQAALVSGRVPVDPSGVTSPISAAALPLPSGAATATNQATGNSSVASIDTKTPALAGGKVPVDGSGVTQPVSAASLPLPAGASTSAKQPALGTAGAASADVLTIQGAASMTAVKVDGSAVTQPVSAAALPLPAGAATSANQAALVSGRVPVDPSGVTSPISAAALPLPSGAAQDGTDATGVAQATGAVGIRGWLSGIYNVLKNSAINVTQTTAANLAALASQGTAAALTAGWPVLAGQTAESTAAWTSATALNTSLQLNCAGYSTVVVTLNIGSTMTGGVLTFEVSDTTAFTNAYAATAMPFNPTNAATTQAQIVTAFALNGTQSNNVSFFIPVAGFAAVRVRLSTQVSGTGTVNVGLAASSASVTPLVAMVRSSINANSSGDNLTSNSNFPSASSPVAFPLLVASQLYGGAFSGTADTVRQGWSKARTPTVFKTVQATASGSTAVWTPGSGNKFRILKFRVQVTANAAMSSGGVLTISLLDSSSSMNLSTDVFVPASAGAAMGGYDSGWMDLGSFGVLSSTANNALNASLSAALTSGNVRVLVAGVEE
jgi:hypothetical protein